MPTPLTPDQVTDALKDLPDWRAEDNALKAEYVFQDFKTALAFIVLVGIEAEKMDHHPEWTNAYSRVNFSFSTHDAGDVITDRDTQMAQRISELATQFSHR